MQFIVRNSTSETPIVVRMAADGAFTELKVTSADLHGWEYPFFFFRLDGID